MVLISKLEMIVVYGIMAFFAIAIIYLVYSLVNDILKGLDTSHEADTLSADSFDAEEFLNKERDIWNHQGISDRNGTHYYEIAELMADFANSFYNKL